MRRLAGAVEAGYLLWRRGQPHSPVASHQHDAQRVLRAAAHALSRPAPPRAQSYPAAFCGSAWLRGCGEPSGARRGTPGVDWAAVTAVEAVHPACPVTSSPRVDVYLASTLAFVRRSHVPASISMVSQRNASIGTPAPQPAPAGQKPGSKAATECGGVRSVRARMRSNSLHRVSAGIPLPLYGSHLEIECPQRVMNGCGRGIFLVPTIF